MIYILRSISSFTRMKKIKRTWWNWIGMYLELQIPDKHSKMTLPYICINIPREENIDRWDWFMTQKIDRVPWLASQTDILSDDWAVTGLTK